MKPLPYNSLCLVAEGLRAAPSMRNGICWKDLLPLVMASVRWANTRTVLETQTNTQVGNTRKELDYAPSRPLDKLDPHILGWPHVGAPARWPPVWAERTLRGVILFLDIVFFPLSFQPPDHFWVMVLCFLPHDWKQTQGIVRVSSTQGRYCAFC